MKIRIPGGHTIEIIQSIFGKETIRYNGRIVSEAITTLGVTPAFVVNEDGKDVKYEVEREARSDGNGYRYTIKREDEIVYADRH